MNLAQPLVQQALMYGALDEAPNLIFVADDRMKYVAGGRPRFGAPAGSRRGAC